MEKTAVENSNSNTKSKEDMLKEEKQAAMEKVASVYTTGYGQQVQAPYPSPYVTLSDMSIPNKMSELFKMCKWYNMFDPLVAGAINALATFPITEVYLEESNNARLEMQKRNAQMADVNREKEEEDKIDDGTEESDQLKTYKRVILEQNKLHMLLVGMGIDYWLFGNCFVFGEMWVNPLTKQKEWKHLFRIDPNRIIIDKNEATQEIKYKMKVPNKIKNIVKKKQPRAEYDKIPDIIKEAVRKEEMVVLNPNNIYHMARPSDSMDDTCWGTPVIANVMKLLLYRNVLRQAQEAIAREHIVPFRIFYFENTPTYNPGGNMDNVVQSFSAELVKSTRDPNYKVISPVPVGVLNLGGQGKALMLTPEIEQVQSEILAGMGVPREFIFGGMSWSGSSISLKILENQFITYRLLIKDFLKNFLVKNMARERGEWRSDKDDDNIPNIAMTEIKMQDDVQQKQLIISLNQTGKVPDETVWKVMGFDPDIMREALKEEAKRKIEQDEEVEVLRIESQTRIQIAQLKAQMELQKVQTQLQNEFAQSPEQQQSQQIQMQQQAQMQQAQGAEQPQPGEEEQPQDPQQEQGGQPQPQPQEQGGGQEVPSEAQGAVDAIIAQLKQMPSNKALEELQKLSKQAPPEIIQYIRSQISKGKNSKGGKAPQQGQPQEQEQPVGEVEAQKLALQLLKMPEEEAKKNLAMLNARDRQKVENYMRQIKSQMHSDDGEEDDENQVDMRPMPTQRPPRRDSLK